MRTVIGRILVVALLGLGLAGAAPARGQEAGTMASAAEVLQAFCGMQPRLIPPALLRDAQGVAVIPHVVKAGFVFGGRFGRGVILVRDANGCWGNPIFITLGGASIGWQIGVQATDIVLIFKTRSSLERVLKGKGKVTLGADVAVAAGPLGRQAEAGTDAELKAEIFSYSRSRGLFAGLSLEGAGLLIDFDANEFYYRVRGGHPLNVLACQAVPVDAMNLRVQLSRLTAAPAPVIVASPPVVPAYPPPPPVRP